MVCRRMETEMMVVVCFNALGKKSGEAFFGGVTGLGGKVTRNLVGEPFFFLVWSERCNDKERGLRYDTILYVTMTTAFSRIAWANVRRGAAGCGGVWRNWSVRSASSATTGRTRQADVRELYRRRNASGLYYTMR